MKIKKFQKPALKLDKSQEDVKISPEREAEIRASQQADLEELWRNRRKYEEQKKLEETNKTPEDRYLDFLDKHGLMFLGDSERQAALDKMGFREIPGSDGVPVITQKPEQALQSEDADFAMALAGGLGTKAAAKAVGWLPTIAEEIGASVVGTGATYGSNYLGQAIDNKYGTNVTPWLTVGGGLAGAFLGGHWGNRGAMKTAKYTIDNGIRGYGDFHPAIQEEILKTPKLSTEPLLNVGWAPAQTMNIRRAGELDTMYYPSRWDVTNEGANPFGVWLQGKYGVPRTDITNPGKGEKAARARQIFEDRPQYVGNVSFKKPIQTVGEVSDRSALSYDAERMGADGIIYNNVYDNGWNNNQVVFSFNKPKLSESSNAAPRIMWMGPTTGKTTYAKNNFNIVDIDPLTKDTRKRVAGELGMDFRDPRVSASPVYQQAVVDDVVKPWLNDPLNNGKTLVASTKHLLDPKYGIKFDNEPFLPDFNTFVSRNQARGFRETPEQLRAWYDSILKIKPDIKIDNSYVNDDMFSRKTVDNISSISNNISAPTGGPFYTSANPYENKFNQWLFDKNRIQDIGSKTYTVDDLRKFVKSLGNRDGNKVSISATDMNLRRNFEDFVDELTQENTYHKALSANDILGEFNLMAEKETPINPSNYAHIGEYFEHDAFPRLMESFKRSGVDLKPEDVSHIRWMYAYPFNGIKATIGYTPPGTGGFSRGTDLVRFSNRNSPLWENVKDDTIVHELHHNLRKRLAEYLKSKGYDINPGGNWLPEALESGSWSRNNNVRGAYLPSELETMKPLAMLDEFNVDKTPAAEIGAVTAGNARFRAWSNLRGELGRIPTMGELDRRINNYDDYKFYKRTSTLPYGKQIGSKAYDDFAKKSAGSSPDDFDIMEEAFIGNMANYWRDAMKYIGGTAGLTVGLGEISNSEKDKQY